MKRKQIQPKQRPSGRTVADLAEAKREFAAVLGQAPLVAVLLDPQGRLFYANDSLLKLTGYKRREIIGRDWFSRFVPDFRPDVKEEFLRGLRRGKIAPRFENPIRAKNGESHLIAWNNQTLRGPDGAGAGAASIGVNLSVLRISRRAQIITAANWLVNRSKDEMKLLAGLCRLLVKQGGYRMAWVGYARDDRAKSVQPMAQAGFVKGYLKNRRVSWGINPRGRGPAGRAIRTGKAVVIQRIVTDPAFPPWRQDALRHGYASCAALPLHDHGEIRGVLMLYATDPDAFDSNEMELLGQLADDLTFGSEALRDYREREEAQERLRKTLESIGDGFLALDRDWRYVYVNAAAERMLGIPRERLLGQMLWDLFPDKKGTELERQFRRAASGESADFEDYFETWQTWFHNRCFPRMGGGVAVYFRDVTAEKKAVEALRESEEKFRALFDTATDGLFLLQPEEQRFRLANPACLRMLGYTWAEFQQLRLEDLHRPEDMPDVRREIAKFGDVRFGIRVDLRFKRKDGSAFLADLSTTRVMFGGERYILVSIRDVDERRRLEAALALSQAELRALLARMESAREEERTRIARDIHDDFGQSLTAIKMDLRQIERIVRETAPTQALEEILQHAADSIETVDAALATVQELAARLRPGVLDRIGLGPALQYEARRFQERHGIACAAAVPAAVSGLEPAATTALFRIFQECLTNVARHAQASRVDAALELAGQSVCLRVRDDGVGIPESALANPASLGLIGIRERVAALGGEVAFRRGEKKGTVVEVRLPRRGPTGKTADGGKGSP